MSKIKLPSCLFVKECKMLTGTSQIEYKYTHFKQNTLFSRLVLFIKSLFTFFTTGKYDVYQ